MKEVIIESVVTTTEIVKVPDDQVDEFVQRLRTAEEQRAIAKDIKHKLSLDDAAVSKLKLFVRDILEKTPD